MNSISRISKFAVVAALAPVLLAQSAAQKERDLKVDKPPEKPVVKSPRVVIPKSYALVIGIANYQNLPAKAQLEFPERDAEAVFTTLISPEGGNFRVENVHKLVGSKATLANIRRELEEWLPSVAKDDDRVLIYFAGHGFVNQGQAYLAPYDISPNNISNTGYPMATLGKVVGSKIRAKWKVLLTDSCHSGSITPAADVQTINTTLTNLDRSLFSLTASRAREQSFESKEWGGGHGIFTYYVVRGLEGAADESKDGIVNADELAEYVRRNVREATGGKQNPTSERGDFDPNMLLAYIPSGRQPDAPPPPKDGAFIFVSNMDDVEVFLDGKSVGVVGKSGPLRIPGLMPGAHTIKAVKMGYEPDGPREEMLTPGGESTITIKITIPRRRNRAAADAFEKGLDEYNKGTAAHYKRAAANFESAMNLDASYSQAALYAARAYNALFDQDNAKKNFERAIAIDPDYLEARATYGGMLLDIGDLDESIRQLNVVVQRDKKNALAHCLLAQAFRRKDLYTESIEEARKSIQLNPLNGEAHLWLAESLRMAGKHANAITEYNEYLRLSDFDSKLAGKLNYWVMGFITGTGKKKRANLKDIWADMRSLTYFGLCDSERQLKNFDRAIEYCQQSLTYDPTDPYVHFALGLIFATKAQQTGAIEALPAARKHFNSVIEISSTLEEAKTSQQNIANIDAFFKQHQN